MYKNNCKDDKKFRNTFGLKYKAIVKVCTFILISVSLSILIAGCNINRQNLTTTKNTSTKDTATKNTEVDNVKNPYPIDEANIKSITRLNVSPVDDRKFAVLEPGKNKDKIDKIIKLINSGSNVRVSTEEDLAAFRGKGPYPTTLEILNNDNSCYIIMPAYTVTVKKLNNGNIENDKTPVKGRFILQFFKVEFKGEGESYTVFSNEMEDYLCNTTTELVDDFR